MSAPTPSTQTAERAEAAGLRRTVTAFLGSQQGILLGFLAALVVVFTLKSTDHVFWSKDSLSNVLNDACPILLLAIGQTFVVIAGGIDLSVGSNAALSGVVAALTMRNLTLHEAMGPNLVMAVGLVVAVVVGTVVGIVNALLISKAKLVAFVATLATLAVCSGLAVVFTQGGPVGDGPRDQAIAVAVPRFWAFSIAMVVVVVIAVIAWLFLHRARFGRYTFAMGSNPFATRAAGISLERHTTKVYALSGFLAGLAGIFFYCRLGSGSPSSGLTKELDSIASVVIGGVALTGGVGTLVGTLLGGIILSTVASGLIMIGVQPNWRQVVVGALIAAAGAVQALRKVNGRPS